MQQHLHLHTEENKSELYLKPVVSLNPSIMISGEEIFPLTEANVHKSATCVHDGDCVH